MARSNPFTSHTTTSKTPLSEEPAIPQRLVDAFRNGTAPPPIRRKAAEGDLPVSGGEKIEILTLLASDQEREIRDKALQTLLKWNAEELQQVLSDTGTPVAVLDFAATHLVSSREELLEPLLANPKVTDDICDRVLAHIVNAGNSEEIEPSSADGMPGGQEGDDQRETLIQKINRMSAVEKIKLALTGSQESRMILIRDGNKVVSRTVLQSPKITETEIESYAAAKNVSEEALRLIAMNRKFTKNYAVVRALVNNPRAPIDITLPLMNRLMDKDLKALTFNRNVPEVLRNNSAKIIKAKEEAQKVKIPRKH